MTPIDRTRAALARGEAEEIKSALAAIGGLLEAQVIPDLPANAELPRDVAQALEVLGEALGCSSWHVRRLAASILVETGAIVIPMLGRLVATGNLDQVYWACYVLARLDGRAGPLLAKVVKSPNRDHRLYAIHALARRKEPDAVASLILALDDQVWSTRRKAADALSSRSDREKVVELLREEVTRGNRNRIYWGIKVLSAVLGERALPILKSLISWKDDDLRYLGIVALGKLKTPEVAQLLISYLSDPSQVVREKAVDLLGQHGEPVRIPLLELANSAQPETRFWALKALQRVSPDDFLARCRALSVHPTPELRYVSIRALALASPADAVPLLISSFSDALWVVRKFASDTIVRMGEPAIPPLFRALSDGTEDTQYWSISTLARMGRPALAGLREALIGGDRTARGFAIASLADADLPQEALGLLVEAFSDDHWPLRKQAADTVRGHGLRALPYLLPAAFEKDDNRRFWSRKVLAELLGPEFNALAEGLERFPELVRRRAAAALAALSIEELKRAILLDADTAVKVLKAPIAEVAGSVPGGALLPQVTDDPSGYLVRLVKLVQEGHGVEVYLRAGIPPTVRVDDQLVRIEVPALVAADVRRLADLIREGSRSADPAQGVVEIGFDLGVVGRCRARMFHEARGLVVVIRPLGLQAPRLRDAGDEEALEPLARLRTGLIVISGPPVSGRTTTAHALIDAVNAERAVHIATVEAPVEHQHAPRTGLVTQLSVPADAATFADGFRVALGNDARVIYLSDVPDAETAFMAIEAAATNTLVIATVRSLGAVAALRHLLELTGPARRERALALMSHSLRASVSQVLVPHVSGKGTVIAREILLGVPNVLHPLAQGRFHEIEKLLTEAPPEGLRSFAASLRALVARGVISQASARDAAPARVAASEVRVLEGRSA